LNLLLNDVAFESNLIDPHTLVIPTGVGAPATAEWRACPERSRREPALWPYKALDPPTRRRVDLPWEGSIYLLI